MSRKCFVSYAHRLDDDSVDKFRKIFTDQRDVFSLFRRICGSMAESVNYPGHDIRQFPKLHKS